ncbi:hypothetical protein NECAME_09077 [Necator americanus]|uniref:Uncharacterized protein n=1 Tax=Necator americanus TaxID=51031 RepID=W2THR0_NECAM|nr:hypothetical protein NECAME_09077 [Necator americanus]ETN80557.1 hypothetical protein NECAME_09077 [Necator americanus]
MYTLRRKQSLCKQVDRTTWICAPNVVVHLKQKKKAVKRIYRIAVGKPIESPSPRRPTML